MGKGGSAWTKFATAFYRKEKAKNSNYEFKNALKDAAKAYKSEGGHKSQLGGMDLSSKGDQAGGMDLSSKGGQAGGKRRRRKSQKRQSKTKRMLKRKSRRNYKK